MDAAFEQFKQKQHAIVRYTGVVPLMNNGGSRGLYDEDDEDDQNYISADIFSKLKFDDLRKVHKDQTVFNISEQQFNSGPQYRSVYHYVRSREQQSHEPMQKQVAEQQLPLAGQLVIELGDIKSPVFQKIGVVAAFDILAVADELVDELAALVVPQIDDHGVIAVDDQFCVLVLEAAQRRTFLRR